MALAPGAKRRSSELAVAYLRQNDTRSLVMEYLEPLTQKKLRRSRNAA